MNKKEKENKNKALMQQPYSLEEVILQLYIAKENVNEISIADLISLISQTSSWEITPRGFYNLIKNGAEKMNPIILEAAQETYLRSIYSLDLY